MDKTGKKEGTVINFSKAREEKIEEKRRKYERVIFKHILGLYCVAEKKGLRALELVDVSEDGLSFQLPKNSQNIEFIDSNGIAGKSLTFRLYFSQDSFLPIVVNVQNQRDCIEEGQAFVRFGCSIDPATQSYETFKIFVKFLSKYAETSHQDSGDLKFFFF